MFDRFMGRSCRLAVLSLVCMGVSSLNAQSVEVIPRQMADAVSDLDQWTYVDGGLPQLVTTDANVPHVPYMSINNSLVMAELDRTVSRSFELTVRLRHTTYQRGLWIGVFDETGKQGYGAHWDSSSSTAYSGQGYVNIRKFDLASEIATWNQSSSVISSNSGSGHLVTDTQFALVSLQWDADTNQLTMRVDGQIKVQCTDTSFDNFSRIYLKGNGPCYFDDITFKSGYEPALRCTIPRLIEDDLADLSQWESVDGAAPQLISTDAQVPHVPYMKLNNTLVETGMNFPLQQNVQLTVRLRHTTYQRGLWIGIFDESGKQGYAAHWDSSSSTAYGGQGYVNIRKFDLASEIDYWNQSSSIISSNSGSGHLVTDSRFALMQLNWEYKTGKLTLSIDGQVKVTCTDTDFASFSRVYLKGNGDCYFDDVSLTTGRDSDCITVHEMFNQGGLSHDYTVGTMPLTSPWTVSNGSVEQIVDGDQRIVRFTGDKSRAWMPLPDQGSVEDYSQVVVGFDIQRTNSSGNGGGVFLVDDNGQGVGFFVELAADGYNRTTLKCVKTYDNAQNFSILAYKSWNGVTGTDMHHVSFTWDRSTGDVSAIVDKQAPQTIGTGLFSEDINQASRLMMFNQYSNTIRMDNLTVIRIPTDHVNVLDYGVVADGHTTSPTDNASTIDDAIDEAESLGLPLYVPAGVYAYDNKLTFNGIDVIGAGATTVMSSTDDTSSVLQITGTSPSIVGINMQGVGYQRYSYPESNGIWAYQAADYIISACQVHDTGGAGIFAHNNNVDGTICGNYVDSSLADAIHITGTSRYIQANGNQVYNPGDDQIAVVSYGTTSTCHHVEAFCNDLHRQHWGRGMTVVGGYNVTYARNEIIKAISAGIYVASESSYKTDQWSDIIIADNVLRDTGWALGDDDPNTSTTHPAIMFYARTDYPGVNALITNNRIYKTFHRGVVIGNQTFDVVLKDNYFENVGNTGIYTVGTTDAQILDNTFNGTDSYSMYIDSATTGNMIISGNQLTDINSNNVSYVDVINIRSGSQLTTIEISDNNYENPAGYVIERYIENHLPAAQSTLINNTTSTSEPIWQQP
tara:strand:+ start:51375 stop:54608 length:3234 start_codon:yes stop_codon:yes gene_type:complete